jgi:Spy/CpxP family protein refolding chaperone
MRLAVRLIVVSVVVSAAAPVVVRARGQEGKWWRNAHIQRELALSATQVNVLERIFASTLSEQRELWRAVAGLERNVQATIAAGDVDDATLRLAIDELGTARARLNTLRAMTLLHMYRTLSPTQRQLLPWLQQPGPGGERPGARPIAKQ